MDWLENEYRQSRTRDKNESPISQSLLSGILVIFYKTISAIMANNKCQGLPFTVTRSDLPVSVKSGAIAGKDYG